ncbi:MAG TPA: EAL domain-containing protein [Pseudoalteromonas prydzensis]|uniref:cyclic-guanylate-specific phosphodiesterase n=2 Tax=Gammaproteobacteria TaxID=1236 RepID=A0A7V1CVC0_9GAMM|nr:EAL domain-containing protein [Pseudoalteromonas prydzensis]HEA14982.1 EAL domain-containing protein [Pseudoalteromonas prydzensis]
MPKSSRYQKVCDVFTDKVLSCSKYTQLIDVVKLMRAHNVSAIFVQEGQQICGIWTEADCIKLDFTDSNIKHLEIRSVMSSPVLSISSSQLLSDAALVFHQHNVRHLLVVDENELPCGVVSITDIVRNQGLDHYLQFRPIKDQYHQDVLVVPSHCALNEAVSMMRERAEQVILVYNQQLNEHGIITQRDLLHLIIAPNNDISCWQLASRPLYQVHSKSSLFDAYRLMSENNVRHLVVSDEQAIKGVLTLEHLINEIENAYCSELEKVLEQRDIALQHSQRNLYLANKIIDASLDGIMITQQDGVIIQVNPAFTVLTGYKPKDVIGQHPRILSSGKHSKNFYIKMWQSIVEKGVWQGEICNRKKNGDVYVEWLTIIKIREPNSDEIVYAAIFSDITERKNAEEKIVQLAYFDELTGLPNRRLFNDRLSMALAAAHRCNDMLAVMFIDLDRFKEINDSLGHSAGDVLLKLVAKRIQSVLREGDTLARLGGDEFVVLCEIDDIAAVISIADKILSYLNTPFQLEGFEVGATASIGAAVYPDDGLDSETLLKHADIAMYRSKAVGRNSFQLFKSSMNARSLERLAMMSRFQHALENDEFELYFQPKQCLKTNKIKGVEALLRWHDPALGLISPAQFIPLAEELGLIVKLDLWVLNNAGIQLALWQKLGITAGRLAINISACHLSQGKLSNSVEQMLQRYNLPGHCLEIELTESSFISSLSQAKKELQQLKKMGVQIALDDFGTGYSALSYLTKLPIDTLKIDASFIAKVPDEYGNSEVVAAIVAMANSLNLQVIAEGVEKLAQYSYLLAIGCDVIQGYYYCRPLTQRQWLEFYQLKNQPTVTS